jgi:glutathione S-transferase
VKSLLADQAPVLWQLEVSHFSEKARWALDFKRIPHRRRNALPGLHGAQMRLLGAGGTVPALVLAGRTFGDSTAIIAELERLKPEPRLYPADEEERARALGLEEFFDEQCGHEVRRAMFDSILRDRELVIETFGRGYGRILRGATRMLYPAVEQMTRRRYRVDPNSAELARERVRRAFDRIEEELGDGDYLVGGSFTVADLTAAALLAPLVVPPELPHEWPGPARFPDAVRAFRESVRERPGFRWVLEMYRRHRRAETP